MKWFKHDCDASEDSRIKKLKHKFGMEGYGVFFNTLELIGRKMENNISSFGFLPSDWDDEALEIEFGLSSDKVRTMFDYMCQIGLFEEKEGRIYNSKIVDRCDDYTSRIVRFKQFPNSKYEHSSNTVRTKSDFVRPRLDIDKNRIDKNIKKTLSIESVKKNSSIKSITDIEINEIAEKYNVPIPFVHSKYDDLINYCESKGKRYKNYYAALCNWVKQDAMKIRKEAEHGSKSKVAIIS